MNYQLSQSTADKAGQSTVVWFKSLLIFLGVYGLSVLCIIFLEIASSALIGGILQVDIAPGGLLSFAVALLGGLLISVLVTQKLQRRAFPRIPYAMWSAMVFAGFYAIGLVIIAATGVGILYTMPQWVAIGQLADFLLHSIVTTQIDLRDDWYVIGIALYTLVGWGSGLILTPRVPPRTRALSILITLALFQVVIYASLLLLNLTGIYDPMKNF